MSSSADDKKKRAGAAGRGARAGGDDAKAAGKRTSVKRVSALLSAPAQIMGPRLLFILSMVLLCAIGLVMVYSASSIVALNSSDLGNDPAYYLKRQALFMGLGVAVCVGLAAVPYRIWANKIVFAILWLGTVALLALTALGMGVSALGAERSIVIAGFALQPSEFAKISILLTVASLFQMQREEPMPGWHFVGAVFLALVIPLYLIYKQPDLGTAIILLVGAVMLFALVGVHWGVIAGVFALILAYVVFVSIVQPYHIDRIVTMLDPWADPQGKGYQSIQSLYALGSGGIFGTGLGLSRQKYLYLPYAHTDFIFAIIGEELGLVGTATVVLLFACFVLAGIRIARNAPDVYGASIAGALTSMLGFQACVNMACVIGIAPVTGKALPFLSYGGSSIIATMIICGLVLSVSFRSSADAVHEQRRDNLFVLTGNAGSSRSERGGSGTSAQQAGLRVIEGLKGRAERAAGAVREQSGRTPASGRAKGASAGGKTGRASSARNAKDSASSTRASRARSGAAGASKGSAARASRGQGRAASQQQGATSRGRSAAGQSTRRGYGASLDAGSSRKGGASTRSQERSGQGASDAGAYRGRIKYPSRTHSASSSQRRRRNRPGSRN